MEDVRRSADRPGPASFPRCATRTTLPSCSVGRAMDNPRRGFARWTSSSGRFRAIHEVDSIQGRCDVGDRSYYARAECDALEGEWAQ